MKRLFAALMLIASPLRAEDVRVAAALEASGFSGYALVVRGEATLFDGDVKPCPPSSPDAIVMCDPLPEPGDRRWPWASVSKQMAALVTLRQVERGRLSLDDRIDKWLKLPGDAPSPTVRQLLQHQSGLRNSNDTPVDPATGLPSFYTGRGSAGWCLQLRGAPGRDWSYNNCDYVVLDAVLQRATGRSVKQAFDEDVAKPLGLKATGFLPARDPNEPLGRRTARLFAGYGAAGALAGTPHELLAIDRALLAGKLLRPASRDMLWSGNPKLGYMALGQWAFEAPLKGCAKPVRIIERRGGIDVTQVRNILLPESGTVVILFTNQGEDAFDFGEIWQGRGLSHDLLSAAACS